MKKIKQEEFEEYDDEEIQEEFEEYDDEEIQEKLSSEKKENFKVELNNKVDNQKNPKIKEKKHPIFQLIYIIAFFLIILFLISPTVSFISGFLIVLGLIIYFRFDLKSNLNEKNNQILGEESNFEEESEQVLTEEKVYKVNVSKTKNTKEKKEIYLSYIFIIWFIFSLLGLILFNGYQVIIFGQYFIVFGIMFIKGKNKSRLESIKSKPIPLLVIMIGLCCIIVPILMMYPNLLPFEINFDNITSFLFLLGIIYAGIMILFFTYIDIIYLRKYCTYPVKATIIKYKKEYSSGARNRGIVYCPIYGFTYNGKEYKVSNNKYTNLIPLEIGKSVDLKINPNFPKEFLANPKVEIIFFIFGTISGLIALALGIVGVISII